jgi:hypothetical protein
VEPEETVVARQKAHKQVLFVFHTMAPWMVNWYQDSKLIYYNYLSILRSLKLVKQLSAQHDIEVFLDAIGHLN